MSGHVFNAFEEKRYRIGSDRRIFYLWQDDEARELFESLGFKVCDFSNPDPRSPSPGPWYVWMSYVLGKIPVK
jgi:hypothetical protein